MAMSVVYSNFCGMVVSETRGGVESNYVHDTLGSTIGLMDSAGVMTDRWEYWPYGEVVSRTGTNPTPLTFLGVIGYFQDVLSKLFYVRARHLRVDLARWLTVDPLWPSQPGYAYASNIPTQLSDPLGLFTPIGSGSGSETFPLSVFVGFPVDLALQGYTLKLTWQWSFSWCPGPCPAGTLLHIGIQGWAKVYLKLSAGKILDVLLAGAEALLISLLCGALFLTINPTVGLVAASVCGAITAMIEAATEVNTGSICKSKDGTRCFYGKTVLQCCSLPSVAAGCC